MNATMRLQTKLVYLNGSLVNLDNGSPIQMAHVKNTLPILFIINRIIWEVIKGEKQNFITMNKLYKQLLNGCISGKGEEVLSAKRWDRRSREVLIKSATPGCDAQVAGLYLGSNPVLLNTVWLQSQRITPMCHKPLKRSTEIDRFVNIKEWTGLTH